MVPQEDLAETAGTEREASRETPDSPDLPACQAARDEWGLSANLVPRALKLRETRSQDPLAPLAEMAHPEDPVLRL